MLRSFEKHEVHAKHAINIFEYVLVIGKGGATAYDARIVAELPNR